MTDQQKSAELNMPTEEQLANMASSIDATLQKIRPDIGLMVSEHGAQGAHPLGVALALAAAATTVVSSMAVSSGMPQEAMDAVIDSLFNEARTVASDTFKALNNLKQAGLSPSDAAEIIQENLVRHAAERDTTTAANDA